MNLFFDGKLQPIYLFIFEGRNFELFYNKKVWSEIYIFWLSDKKKITSPIKNFSGKMITCPSYSEFFYILYI
jgi:hypothetical protein